MKVEGASHEGAHLVQTGLDGENVLNSPTSTLLKCIQNARGAQSDVALHIQSSDWFLSRRSCYRISRLYPVFSILPTTPSPARYTIPWQWIHRNVSDLSDFVHKSKSSHPADMRQCSLAGHLEAGIPQDPRLEQITM